MKTMHSPILDLISQNKDLEKLLIDSFRDQKSSETTNTTVSLPPSAISKIEKLNADYDYSTKRIIQLIVKTFTYMEKYFQSEDQDFKENLLLMKEYLLEKTFSQSGLIKKSYVIDKRDSIHLKLIAKRLSISRNELISIGVLMVASHLKQHEKVYSNYVKKYRVQFERILSEVQKIKNAAIQDLDVNDQIVLMAERLAVHLEMQLIYYGKFEREGIWYVGPSDSENVDYVKLISELLSPSKPSLK